MGSRAPCLYNFVSHLQARVTCWKSIASDSPQVLSYNFQLQLCCALRPVAKYLAVAGMIGLSCCVAASSGGSARDAKTSCCASSFRPVKAPDGASVCAAAADPDAGTAMLVYTCHICVTSYLQRTLMSISAGAFLTSGPFHACVGGLQPAL